jgi:hypothetical protein
MEEQSNSSPGDLVAERECLHWMAFSFFPPLFSSGSMPVEWCHAHSKLIFPPYSTLEMPSQKCFTNLLHASQRNQVDIQD